MVAADLDLAAAQETVAGIDGVAVAADVCDSGDVAGMVATAVEQFGALDVFHNNAGLPEPTRRWPRSPAPTGTRSSA